MAMDTTTPRSRRALLTAAAGAVAATAVQAVARPLSAQAITQSVSYENNETGATVISGESVHQSGFPSSGSGVGVFGYSTSHLAVYGSSGSGTGVYGGSNSGAGLSGQSVTGTGVSGESDSGTGVFGRASAASGTTYGVYGRAESTGGTGMLGYAGANSGTTYGVLGYSNSPSGKGGGGWSGAKSTGLIGYSNDGTGSVPVALPNTGVYGSAPLAGGRGGQFTGKAAQIRLRPSIATTHPSSGLLGDLFLDKNKRLWFCKGGTTWKQLA